MVGGEGNQPVTRDIEGRRNRNWLEPNGWMLRRDLGLCGGNGSTRGNIVGTSRAQRKSGLPTARRSLHSRMHVLQPNPLHCFSGGR